MKLKTAVAVFSALLITGLAFSAHFEKNVAAGAPPSAGAKPPVSGPTAIGQWSSPISLGMVAIHGALLNTGQVLFWQYLNGQSQYPGTIAILFNPANNQVTSIPTAPTADFFCAGNTHLADGTVLIDGGLTGPLGEGVYGSPSATIYNPATGTFSTNTPNMNYWRYYPTNTALPNGMQLVMSGENQNGSLVEQLEEFDPSQNGGTWTVLPASANLPTPVGFSWEDYPRNFLLGSGNILVTNQNLFAYVFNPTTNTWSSTQYDFNDHYRGHDTGVLLPDPPSCESQGTCFEQVMIIGGGETEDTTNTTETIDFTQSSPQWTMGPSMNFARHDMNAIDLPDGTILVIGGAGAPGEYTDPVLQAEIYNPTTQMWTVAASQKGNRSYHSTALLLPDGRVISAGSDSGNIYQSYAEIYSPPYMFAAATRPAIIAAPTSVNYGQTFTVSTPQDASIKSVAFIREDATTHADHMDQRMLNLPYSDQGNGTLQVTAPANSNYAPPGYYMLFIVNSNGIPSVASIIQMSSSENVKAVPAPVNH